MNRIKMFAVLFAALLLASACAPQKEVPAADTPGPTLAPTEAPSPSPTQELTPSPTPGPIEATLYVPNPQKKRLYRMEVILSEDSPLALINALVLSGALPDVDYKANFYFEVNEEDIVKIDEEKATMSVARIDLPQSFATAIRAIKAKTAERITMQSLINTFIDYYKVDAVAITIEGDKMDSKFRTNYEHGLTFDMYAETTDETITPTPVPTPSPVPKPTKTPRPTKVPAPYKVTPVPEDTPIWESYNLD